MRGAMRMIWLAALTACASTPPSATRPAPPAASTCFEVRSADAASGYVRTQQAWTDPSGRIVRVRFDERIGTSEHRNEARYAYDRAGRLVGSEEYLLHPVVENGRPEQRTDAELTQSVHDVYGPHGELTEQTLFLPRTSILSGGHDTRDVRRYAWHGTFRNARGGRPEPLRMQLDRLALPLVELRVYGSTFEGTVLETSGEFTGATQTFDRRGRLVQRTLGGGDPFVERRAYADGDEPVRVALSDKDDDEATTTRFDRGRAVSHELVKHQHGVITREVTRDEYGADGQLAREVTQTTEPDGQSSTLVTTLGACR